MKLWRCQICGEPYLGERRPTNCPFCGAHERSMVPQEALELEIDNTGFYACAARKSTSDEAKNLFKALSKVESEHASVISKALGVKKPVVDEADICTGDYQENLTESHRREEKAIKHYGKFLSEAAEPRVQEIFSAIIAIEADHLSLSEERMK
jgi:rubrerythrin